MGFVGQWKRRTSPGYMIYISTSTAMTAELVLTLSSRLTDPISQFERELLIISLPPYMCTHVNTAPPCALQTMMDQNVKTMNTFFSMYFSQTQILNTCSKYLYWPIMIICLNNKDPISL